MGYQVTAVPFYTARYQVGIIVVQKNSTYFNKHKCLSHLVYCVEKIEHVIFVCIFFVSLVFLSNLLIIQGFDPLL